MVANIVDIDSLFNTVFDTCKDTADIGFSTVRGPRLAGSEARLLRIESVNVLSIKVNSIRTKETNVFQAFHVR